MVYECFVEEQSFQLLACMMCACVRCMHVLDGCCVDVQLSSCHPPPRPRPMFPSVSNWNRYWHPTSIHCCIKHCNSRNSWYVQNIYTHTHTISIACAHTHHITSHHNTSQHTTAHQHRSSRRMECQPRMTRTFPCVLYVCNTCAR